MTRNKRTAALFAAMLLTITVAPVSLGADESPAADACVPVTGENLPIGFAEVTLQSPFYVELVEAEQAEAEALGYEMTMLDADGDVAKQNRDVQDLITKGVKVLILNPANPEAVQPSIEAALGHPGAVLLDFHVENVEDCYPMMPPGVSLSDTIDQPPVKDLLEAIR